MSLVMKEISMFDLRILCPHCDENLKLNMIGAEGKEFIQCPHCRRVIKLDAAQRENQAMTIQVDDLS